ncbi:MAG TPA: DUF2795 domain-containing protein [Gaiellaceae bacterium]|nr:DUF2795 domain-containing protein [Gaiellaceae bacterium]
MDRDSTKHGPRADDELAAETEAIERGSPVEPRVQEGREKEGGGEEDRDVDARTARGGSLGADEVEARRELSRHLRLGAFPADRARLLAEAEEADAPAAVLAALRRLPADAEYGTVHEVWVALEDPSAADDRDALRSRAAAEPLSDADR